MNITIFDYILKVKGVKMESGKFKGGTRQLFRNKTITLRFLAERFLVQQGKIMSHCLILKKGCPYMLFEEGGKRGFRAEKKREGWFYQQGCNKANLIRVRGYMCATMKKERYSEGNQDSFLINHNCLSSTQCSIRHFYFSSDKIIR